VTSTSLRIKGIFNQLFITMVRIPGRYVGGIVVPEESMDASFFFSSTSTILVTLEVWVIPTILNMLFLMVGFGDSEGGSKKTVRWSTYVEEVGCSRSSSFELMQTKDRLVEKTGSYAFPVGNLVLNGTGSSYVALAILSFNSSNSEKNEREVYL